MFAWSSVRDWLKAESTVKNWVLGPVNPTDREMPDIYGVLTPQQWGPGMTDEGTFDRLAAQVSLRGIQRVEDSPYSQAGEIDRLLVFGSYPHSLWGEYCNSVYRFGGAPAPLLQQDKAARRTIVCTYIFQVAT